MKIKEAVIRNFGQFHNKKITFSPGLNVVYGNNESGKSTLHTFLVAMLFGMEKARGRGAKRDRYTQYEPWNSASFYSGEMDFEVEGKEFHLERSFYHKEKHSSLLNVQDGEVLCEEYGDLQMLLGGMTKELYESTCCISQTGVVPGKELASFVQNSMANAVGTGDGSFQLQKALSLLQNRKNRAAKELKEEEEKRVRQIEKLQMEREILEEDIARLKKKENSSSVDSPQEEMQEYREENRAHLWILVIGCFLAAGCFLSAVFFDIPLKTAMAGGIMVCILTAFSSVLLYRTGKKSLPQSPKTGWGRKDEEQREKQTRLFNILEYQTELEHPTEREQELKQDMMAYDFAAQTIRGLTGEIYEDFGDRINSRTSQILSELTKGRYDRVEVDENMEVSVYSGNRVCRPQQLSAGTLEQIYFALRMSMGEILSKEEPMPYLLDETFSTYDEKRVCQALSWLGKQKRQIILFTCQKREMEYLEELGIPFEKIELEGN